MAVTLHNMEWALAAVMLHIPVRRSGWSEGTYLYKGEMDEYIMLSTSGKGWLPIPEDLIAHDWQLAFYPER